MFEILQNINKAPMRKRVMKHYNHHECRSSSVFCWIRHSLVLSVVQISLNPDITQKEGGQ